jgi:hypothetical protein
MGSRLPLKKKKKKKKHKEQSYDDDAIAVCHRIFNKSFCALPEELSNIEPNRGIA